MAVSFLTLFVFCLTSANALYAYTDKITYQTNDTISISGLVDSSNSSVNVTASFYNQSGTPLNSTTVLSSNATTNTNTFTITNTINGSYAAGDYYVSVTDGTDTVNVTFGVVAEVVYLEAHLLNISGVVYIGTSSLVSNNGDYGGNFTELRALSLNTLHILHYGNATVGSKTYHFVLADPNYAGVYDTVYIDDDKIFQLYNDTEDSGSASETEKVRKAGEMFGNYVIGEIDFMSGNSVLLGVPAEDQIYSAGEQVYFVAIAKNSSYHIKYSGSVAVNVTLADKNGAVAYSFANSTSSGFFVGNLTAPSSPGFYMIKLNGTPAAVFSVETFKLYGGVTDLSNNPMFSFGPNPAVRVSATVKTSAGDTVNGATVSAVITYPNGSTRSITLNGGNGTYYCDVDMRNDAPNGGYKVVITATYGANTQDFSTGFEIQVVSLDVMAINPQFIEEAEGSEVMVDAFAPNGNVSLMVVLSNISVGGFASKGPEGGGTVDIDNPLTANDECNTSVQLVGLKDDRDVSLDLSHLNVRVMNLTNAMQILMGGMPPGEGPPQGMLRQCMIIFNNISRTGVYKAEVRLKHSLGEKNSGTKFAVQRLYATANPVDFKGEDFWFYAPNTTIRIKLKVTDLVTRQELPAVNITGAKIVEMFKEWPSFQDVFTEGYRTVANESVANGTISFTSPNAEGFFSMRFKFRATVAGEANPVDGSGSGFFMLKKYMIWGQPSGCSQGQPCMKAQGQNITIDVKVVDVSKGGLLDLGQSQSLTCTGCDGLEVSVNEMFNGQVMKRMTEGTDYNVLKGSVNASAGSATMKILPAGNMPSGWYNLDLILRDPANANNTYFGWAWFEIRNFWVDVMPVSEKGGNLSSSYGKATYGIGQNAVFAAAAWNPGEMGPQNLPISSVSIESVNRVSKSGPPVPLQEGVDYSYSSAVRNVSVQMGGPQGMTVEMRVINITWLSTPKSSDYQVNLRSVTSSGSDVGSGWFDVSSYIANVVYRGMEQWPPTFAPTENLTVNVSAYDFEGNPHNLSAAGTRIRSLWDSKANRPIKVNTSTSCAGNNCSLTLNLSQLGASSGRYDVSLSINDTSGNAKEDGLYFEMRGMSVSTPSIREVWVDQFTEIADREININNDRDSCDNQLWMQDISGQWNGTYCIMTNGQWNSPMQGEGCRQNEIQVNVTSNTTQTHIGINDLANYTAGQNFTVAGDSHTWNIVSIGPQPQFHIKHNGSKICGSIRFGQSEQPLTAVQPTNHSTFYFDYVSNLIEYNSNPGDNWFADQMPAFNYSRPVYVYHNTSHVWMNLTPVFNGPGAATGQTISDPYGGQWRVKTISKNKVTLSGINVVARTGAWINTSLSKSGYIKIRAVNEQELGGWDKNSGSEVGVDLNGDGYTNSTVYFAVTDSATSGVYDTLFFSNSSNFSSPVNMNSAAKWMRTFGIGANLTLLSISPDGKKARVYGNRTGDWGELGELKAGSIVRVPVLVLAPSGAYETANVSIKNIRKEIGDAPVQFVPLSSPFPNATCAGLCEISLNLSNLSHPQSGKYSFEITANKDGSEERMDEWRWPFVTMRVFLTDVSVGEGGYVSGFRRLPIYRYDGESYGWWIPGVQDQSSGRLQRNISAAFAETSGGTQNCPSFAKPAAANQTAANWTWQLQPLMGPPLDYWVYANAGNASRMWLKAGDCNFSIGASTHTNGSQVNITFAGHTYMLYVLDVNVTNTSQGVFIGLAGVNSSIIYPLMRNGDSPGWGLMALNLSGTLYDVILANDTIDYPMCGVWNLQQCAKKAWIDTDGNFSNAIGGNATGVYIGQNFTSELYLSKIGAGMWEGISVANFSSVPERPGVDVRVKDNTTSWFGMLNESLIGLDFNKDGDSNDTFYMVAYDEKEDGIQSLTDNVVDDDLNITEEFWSNPNENSSIVTSYKDFYGNESGSMHEYRRSLPRGAEYGGLTFGESQNNMPPEQQPNWDIAYYNGSNMLISKGKWQFLPNESMKIIVRAYGFDQAPLAGANVSVEKLMLFGGPFGGAGMLNASDYSNSVLTGAYGWAVVTLQNTTWSIGEYMIQLRIESSGKVERSSNWFRVRW